MLDMLGAKNYDQLEDMRTVNVQLAETVKELKKKWRTNDMAEIKAKIRQCVVRELMRLEERKLVRREQAEIQRKKRLQREREEENQDMLAVKSMNTSMSGSPFKAGVQFSQAGSSPTKFGSPGTRRGGDAASQSETESRMTGATGFGGKSPLRDIFSMFKGGGQIAELQKEYGKQSGLTAGNKEFGRM